MPPPFSLEDIDRAHQGVTSKTVGTYLRALHELGIVTYTTHLSDGHSDYFDDDGDCLSSAPVHEQYAIADRADPEAARRAIGAHARRETDYFTFSRQLASAGVGSWIMDPVAMTCTFCSKIGEPLLVDAV